MAKYIVKHTTIMHNGRTYAEGSQIELSDNDAARLEDFLEVVPKQTNSSKSNTNKSSTQNKTASKTDGSNDGSSNTDGGNDGSK